MEKSSRLQRYNRKDYSELVEFPVEIVGRDGMVRRYTFEDSIRLYRRRIIFAPIRYRDQELISAEIGHCRMRIEQLRRSFFYRFGWGTPEGQVAAAEVLGDLAGELAAFICRLLRCEGRPEVRIEPVADTGSPVSTWYVLPRAQATGMLLYVYRFQGEQAENLRESFFDFLKVLERGEGAGDGERLLAFHHTVDCGFALTGRGGELEALVSPPTEAEVEQEPLDPTPWDAISERVRRGDYRQVVRRCRALVREQPWHRDAYLTGAVAAIHLGESLEAEDFGLVGGRYFPDEPLMHFYAGLARARTGRPEEAIASLERALDLAPGLAVARLLVVVLHLRRRRPRKAWAWLRSRHQVPPDERRPGQMLHRVEQWLFWRWIMVGSGYGAATLGLGATALAGWFGLLPVVLGLGMAGCGMYAFERELRRIVQRQRFGEAAQGYRRIRRRRSRDDFLVS